MLKVSLIVFLSILTILSVNWHLLGEPANLMKTENVDWCPTLHLGHDKTVVKESGTEVAQNSTKRYEARKRRIEECHAESPKDTNESHKSVATSTDGLVVTREAKVQTDCVVDAHMDFFDEDQFVTDHAKAHYYTCLPNGEVLLATFYTLFYTQV